jgi:hypothetical protein
LRNRQEPSRRPQDAEISRPQILGAQITTVGWDEEVIRAYIRNQELADQQLNQLELKISPASKSNQSSQHPLKPPLAVPNQTSSFAGGYWLGLLRRRAEDRALGGRPMSDLKDCEIERLLSLFASGNMKHAPEIARLLGQELNHQGPKPVPLRASFGNVLRGSRAVEPTA